MNLLISFSKRSLPAPVKLKTVLFVSLPSRKELTQERAVARPMLMSGKYIVLQKSQVSNLYCDNRPFVNKCQLKNLKLFQIHY